jgi:hypothetical protein
MLIKATQDFLDGRARYQAGAVYDVPRIEGMRFLGAGWAQAVAADDALPIVDPVIHQPLALSPEDGAFGLLN